MIVFITILADCWWFLYIKTGYGSCVSCLAWWLEEKPTTAMVLCAEGFGLRFHVVHGFFWDLRDRRSHSERTVSSPRDNSPRADIGAAWLDDIPKWARTADDTVYNGRLITVMSRRPPLTDVNLMVTMGARPVAESQCILLSEFSVGPNRYVVDGTEDAAAKARYDSKLLL